MFLQVLHQSQISFNLFNNVRPSAHAGRYKLWAAGRLNAAEVNAGRSGAEGNPERIVALALRKGMCITCTLLCVLDSVPCLVANGQATNGVKWSGTKDEMNEVA